MTRRWGRLAGGLWWFSVIGVVALGVVWGRRFQEREVKINLGAAPLVGRNRVDGWDWRFGRSIVAAGLLAAVVAVAPSRAWWWRARLRWLVAVSAGAAGAFAVLLALVDGTEGLRYGAEHPTEYLANVPLAPAAGEFVRTFVERIDDYTVHVRGHPPGFVVLLQALDHLGAGGVWPVVALSVASTVLVAAGVLVAVWALAGPDWVRRVAPVTVVAPTAIWMVTSADAVFATVAVWGVATCCSALRSSGRDAVLLGAVSGALLSALLFLTYAGAIHLLIPLVIVVGSWRWKGRRTVPVVVAMVGAAAVVTAAFAAAGFWWFDGVAATRTEYWDGTAQFRTWTYFAVANVAAALIAIGPLSIEGLRRVGDRRLALLVGGGAAAVAAAWASQYTRGEVERVWLIFYPWLVVAGATVIDRTRPGRSAGWIGVQAAWTIVLQAALVTKW